MTQDEFPNLTHENYRVTSPPSADYNCIAWSMGDTEHWWQPGVFWPVQTSADDYGTGVLEQAFVGLGFEACADATLDPGFEKVALYGKPSFYTHAARQLPNGKWTSKLGRSEDIEHETPNDVAGGIYGDILRFMRRPSPNHFRGTSI